MALEFKARIAQSYADKAEARVARTDKWVSWKPTPTISERTYCDHGVRSDVYGACNGKAGRLWDVDHMTLCDRHLVISER